jgi:hypothetical protein
MVNALALFPISMETEKIEELLSRQIDSMKKAEGLISIRISEGNIMSPGGPPSFSKVLESSWSSLEALMSWVQSQTPADKADKEYMLENGAVLLFYEGTEHN